MCPNTSNSCFKQYNREIVTLLAYLYNLWLLRRYLLLKCNVKLFMWNTKQYILSKLIHALFLRHGCGYSNSDLPSSYLKNLAATPHVLISLIGLEKSGWEVAWSQSPQMETLLTWSRMLVWKAKTTVIENACKYIRENVLMWLSWSKGDLGIDIEQED